MKPAPFEYVRPTSIEEVCALLAADEGARVIAGGQTLVPLMAMRLARPTRLVDIARIRSLAHIRETAGAVEIGATTRQCVVENDPLVRTRLPLLAAVMPYIGHSATRARGTIGGSLANADPAAELVLAAVTLGATLVYREQADTREIPASEFFVGPMVTALPPTACLLSVRFPVWRESVGVGFHEINARRSDFAFASAAAQIALDGTGRCQRLALGIGAVAPVPLCLDARALGCEGRTFDEGRVREAVAAALAHVEPFADLHASAEYRRRAGLTLAMRALNDAVRTAQAKHAR